MNWEKKITLDAEQLHSHNNKQKIFKVPILFAHNENR